ncbi:MAG: histidinol phosphate phosphatase domain-containing protein [Deltaproteobacteria bacterium]|nr:histidinol phosphate phosphatase domain-containing protein [Deltaproteobacteria bacterium]MBW2051680.1 histidinol phosphate phosphatase domain-containing protein [Deltaproteobacteria bacterium]MBW2140202.1 histidinol phosphate phosphatase domain-containing protein [Deltaproteobacteria bacterium]MBW2323910.1 histidinol phosphate phosphatase domain-containing protein [Deltaproteobacteria bacterium]
MIDLHTHTLLSDGVLLPSEMVRRAEHRGYRHIALTDHVDTSNMDFAIPRIVQTASEINRHIQIKVIPGAELTHIPPAMFASMTRKARELGAAIVVAHGETPVEPVAPGTNLAAIEAGVDILAHPGLITNKEASLAAEKGVYLEITARKGHSLTNGHVARVAKAAGAKLVLNTDAHAPSDLITVKFAGTVALGAGLTEDDFKDMRAQALNLLKNIGAIQA